MQTVMISFPDDVARDWQVKTGMDLSELIKEAMSLYVWAVEEVRQGRVIFSCNTNLRTIQPIKVPGTFARCTGN